MSEIMLIEKIKADAAKAAADIKANATAEVEAIQRETEMLVAEVEREALKKLEKDKAQHELVAVSKARQAAKVMVQRAKREAIDESLARFTEQVTRLSAAEYVLFFAKHAKAEVPASVTARVVEAPAARTAETADVLSQLQISAEVKPSAHIGAGFILYTESGVYDITLGRLMSERRAELEIAIVQKIS